MIGDQTACQLNQRQVVHSFSFPADEYAAEPVVPGVGALYDPATGPASNTAQERLLAASADVRTDSTDPNSELGVSIVVALVEAQMHWALRTAPLADNDRVQGVGHHPLVMDVRASHQHSQRNSSAVGQDVPLYAAFRAVRRIGPRVVPPFGAFTVALSSEAQSHLMPRLRS